MTPWLDIVGIGEDGFAGLSPAARAAVESADVIMGGDRHRCLPHAVSAERLSWPSPFEAMIDAIRARRGRRLVALVAGDPLWYSVGARILKAIPPEEVRFHPQLSAFQWAAARMGWSLADCATLTVHGRRSEQAIPFFAPGARLLILTNGAETPTEIAGMLAAAGYGDSVMTVLGALGGSEESRLDGRAGDWAVTGASSDFPAFHTLAVECRAEADAALIPRGPGLPDDAFAHDGEIACREVRAAALAKLWPRRGALLWDIGAGCGPVAIEWMRAARDAEAFAIEPNEVRRAMAAENAWRLGAPRLKLIDQKAPGGLAGLPAPDAVFIGGGLSRAVVAAAITALPRHGRLVANAATADAEALLIDLRRAYGGELTKIAVSEASMEGPVQGWRPLTTVTQWSRIV